MKKKLFSAALILAAFVSFNASASQSASAQDVKGIVTKVEDKAEELGEKAKDFGKKAENSIKKEGKKFKKDRKGDRKDDRKGERPDLFKGIDLSAEQKAQLEALRPQRPEGAPRGDKKIKGNKAACDTTQCAAKAGCQKQCDKPVCDKKDGKGPKANIRREGRMPSPEAREEYMNKVKEILTPEQYEVFRSNLSKIHAHGQHRHADKK